MYNSLISPFVFILIHFCLFNLYSISRSIFKSTSGKYFDEIFIQFCDTSFIQFLFEILSYYKNDGNDEGDNFNLGNGIGQSPTNTCVNSYNSVRKLLHR